MAKRRKNAASAKTKHSKSGKVNKSQAIRDYKKANPNLKPARIAEALNEDGIEVSAQFVSTILSNSKKRKTIRKPGRPKGSVARKKSSASRQPSAEDVSFESLLKVKEIVIEMGGIPQAKAALRALEQLLV